MNKLIDIIIYLIFIGFIGGGIAIIVTQHYVGRGGIQYAKTTALILGFVFVFFGIYGIIMKKTKNG